jgi:hypothetical protein
MGAGMRFGTLSGLLAMVLGISGTLAAECPDSQSAKDGFRLATGGVFVEVRQQSDLIVQASTHFADGEVETAFFFRGLIEIARTSKSKQTFMLTLSDLRSLFPLKKGLRKKFASIWLDSRGPPSPPETTELHVAGQETLKVGACEYKVFLVQTHLVPANGSKRLLEALLYSPDLAVVLAKRYEEGTAQETTVGYKEIRLLK